MSKKMFEDRLYGKKARAVQAILHARGYHQAVVRVNHAHGIRQVKACAKYISRKNELPMEYFNGDEHIQNMAPENVDFVLDAWKQRFDKRKDSRDVVTLILSTPKESAPQAALKAARDFVKETFPNNECLMALHTDTQNPHVHLMVEAKDREGKKLRTNPRDLYQYRVNFAEACKRQNILVCANHRSERGKFQKAAPQYEYHIDPASYRIGKKRKKAAEQLAEELRQGEKIKKQAWHKAMFEARERQIESLDNLETFLRTQTNLKSDAEAIKAVKENFPAPFTRIDAEAIQISGIFKKAKQATKTQSNPGISSTVSTKQRSRAVSNYNVRKKSQSQDIER